MQNNNKAMVYGLLAVACWSTVATAFKLSLQYLSPLQLLFYACVTSLFVLVGVVTWRAEWGHFRAMSSGDWCRSALFGLLNPFLYYWVLFSAYDRLPAQQAQAINYSWALTMTLLSVPLLGHSLSWREGLAAVVCYLGVVVVATEGQWSVFQQGQMTGVLLALFSTLLWALYWIYNTRDNRSPVVGLMSNFLLALPMIWGLCYWQGQTLWVPWQGLLGAVYVGAFEMGLAFVFWLMAMKLTTKTARIANLIYLSPLVSLMLISLVLGEAILMSTLMGLALILIGLWIQKQSAATSAG